MKKFIKKFKELMKISEFKKIMNYFFKSIILFIVNLFNKA